jgi:ArsR family transcriptional regulator, arsenate/arsenite/antimonite-responsive transcriptional repressor
VNVEQVVFALEAVAHDVRLTVVRMLVEAGKEDIPAVGIRTAIGMPPSSLFFHLKKLFDAKLINFRVEGGCFVYFAKLKVMVCLERFIQDDCCAVC